MVSALDPQSGNPGFEFRSGVFVVVAVVAAAEASSVCYTRMLNSASGPYFSHFFVFFLFVCIFSFQRK